MVERVRRAGGLHRQDQYTEFGLGSHAYNPVYGATRNAYDQSRSAGGSSGGAAVSLALRMVPVADGRTTAAACAIQPAGTTSSVSDELRAGAVRWGATFGCPPRAWPGRWRNIADLAHVAVGTGGVRLRGCHFPSMGLGRFRGAIEKDFKGKRIAWVRRFQRGTRHMNPT